MRKKTGCVIVLPLWRRIFVSWAALAPYAAVNFIRKGMGYEEYLMEYAQYRRIRPEELLEVLDLIQESAKGMKKPWMSGRNIEEYTQKLARAGKKKQENKRGRCGGVPHSMQ